MSHHVAIGVGGNIGETPKIFSEAVIWLQAGGFSNVRMAPVIVTKPMDCVPGTPDFFNSVIVGDWSGSPQELLALTQSIEHVLGRPAVHSSRESRTLDLDLLLIDDMEIQTQTLVIPHPRLRLRRFALEPLAALEPDWKIPPGNRTVAECLEELDRAEAPVM